MYTRPLPRGVALLLRIAAGAPEPLAAAAAAFNEPPPRVLEATRFYLQQALFFARADAWRLLAASPASDAATLREHHRLLLAWLHPDRGGEAWNATCAARVNAAWDRLRDQARREAYANREAGTTAPVKSRPAMRTVAWHATPARESHGWWPAIALALAVVACIGLWQLNQRARQAAGFQPVVDEPPARDMRATERMAFSALSNTVRDIASLAGATDTAPGVESPPRDPATIPESVASAAPQPAALALQRPAAARIVEPPAHDEPAATIAVAAPVSPAPPMAVPLAIIEPASPAPPDAAVARFEQAIGFLSTRKRVPPPIWNDLDSLDAAQAIRDRLRGCCAAGAVQVMPAEWSLDGDTAHAVAPYRLQRNDGSAQAGIVRVELRARVGNWWVSGVRMEPRP